jgi:hypothetical protein
MATGLSSIDAMRKFCIMPPMRRWIALVLLLLLPLQGAWAAAAAYCSHEAQPAASAHLGHHEHAHAAGDSAPPQPDGTAIDHPDCAGCHGTAAAPADSAALAAWADPSRPAASPAPRLSLIHLPPPDRPNWLAA